MTRWWDDEVLGAGKLPLLLSFLAFVVTFASTRTVTRLIRAGRGPFRDQVRGGTHIHHSVPGLVLLVVGAFTAVGASGLLWSSVAGVLVGTGTSLVLDEFALILHLQDVYWSGEGQLSVSIVSLTAACLGLALVGLTPVSDVGGLELGLRVGGSVLVASRLAGAVVCVVKGKYRAALFGTFVPFVAVFCALRLARPGSRWARRFYEPAGRRSARAARRAASFDGRWGPVFRGWDRFVGGAPSLPDPVAAAVS